MSIEDGWFYLYVCTYLCDYIMCMILITCVLLTLMYVHNLCIFETLGRHIVEYIEFWTGYTEQLKHSWSWHFGRLHIIDIYLSCVCTHAFWPTTATSTKLTGKVRWGKSPQQMFANPRNPITFFWNGTVMEAKYYALCVSEVIGDLIKLFDTMTGCLDGDMHFQTPARRYLDPKNI